MIMDFYHLRGVVFYKSSMLDSQDKAIITVKENILFSLHDGMNDIASKIAKQMGYLLAVARD